MLSLEEAQSRAQDLVSAARKAGADAADAIYACNASTNISVRLGALEDIERSEGEEIGLTFAPADAHVFDTEGRVMRRRQAPALAA